MTESYKNNHFFTSSTVALLVVLLVLFGGLIMRAQHASLSSLENRAQERVEIAAEFLAAHASDVLEREGALAERWLATREGPLASGWTEAIGFVNTKYGPDYPWPDFQLVFVIASLLSDDGFVFRRAYGMTDEMWAVYKPYIHRHSVLIFPVMLQPRSRGTVKLASWDPNDYPLINPNYFGIEYVIKFVVIKQFDI